MTSNDTVDGGTEAPTALARLDDLLRADDAAVVVFGLDGSLVDLNDVGRAALGVHDDRDLVDGTPARDLLRALLDQVPQQLLTDPDG
ncbi:MAG: hypothetical protein MUE78_10800, partial [Ilumatobacteraceae bacterium]|nr:hypothetical protein [Ilumatobacteraceae bacterium]